MKIVARIDGLGNLVRVLVLPGRAQGMKGGAPLIRGLPFGAPLADRAFDTERLSRAPNARGAISTGTSTNGAARSRTLGAVLVPMAHHASIAKIKEFRAITARYDKTDCRYAANWTLAPPHRRKMIVHGI